VYIIIKGKPPIEVQVPVIGINNVLE